MITHKTNNLKYDLSLDSSLNRWPLVVIRVLRAVLAGVLAYLNMIPSLIVIFNPLLFIMFLPLGVYFLLTWPWAWLRDLPDPLHPGESLYWLTYAVQLGDTPILPSLFRWGILDSALTFIGSAIFISSFLTWLRGLKRGLVTYGVYGAVRHPQYLGIVLLSLGLSVRSLRPASFIAWLTLLFGYLTLASLEERDLLKTYGERYERYREMVPFMIPLFNFRTPRWLSPRGPYRYILLLTVYIFLTLMMMACLRSFVFALRTTFQ